MISILLPVYNGEKFIRKSIDSIIYQNYKDWELLIGFNGTNDNSKNIVSEYSDSRIRVFDYLDDKGKSKTLNKLLKESKYDWIALQDDDDMWHPDKLEKQILYTKSYDIIGTQMVYCDIYDSISDGPVLATDDSDIKRLTISGNNQIANASSLIRKSVIDGWDESDWIQGLEDYDFWVRLIIRDFKFFNLSEKLFIHRMHRSSNFNTMSMEKHNDIMYKIWEKNGLLKC